MEGRAKPDYATCLKISTDASIKEMIPPGALVMLTPLIVGILFGVETSLAFSPVLLFLVSRLQYLHPTPVVHGTMPRIHREHARTLDPQGIRTTQSSCHW